MGIHLNSYFRYGAGEFLGDSFFSGDFDTEYGYSYECTHSVFASSVL